MQAGGSLTHGQGLILGIVQGLTEFLPISSSAHLAISQRWLGLDPDSLPMHVFDGVSHVGTVLAVFFVFFRSFRGYLTRLTAELRPEFPGRRYALRFAMLGGCASVPTAMIGLGFKDHFEHSFGNRFEVGLGLLITAALLMGTTLAGRGTKGWNRFHWWHAALIGVAQGVAISPGISRSGATISTATLLGIRRRWAAEFSFFIAIPAILGATILKLREAMLDHAFADSIAWLPILSGGAAALIAGIVSLKLLLGAVRRASLHHFSWYCLALGVLVLTGLI